MIELMVRFCKVVIIKKKVEYSSDVSAMRQQSLVVLLDAPGKLWICNNEALGSSSNDDCWIVGWLGFMSYQHLLVDMPYPFLY